MSLNLEKLFAEIREFNQTTHGSSNYDKDPTFVQGESTGEFAPLTYLQKKIELPKGIASLVGEGLVCDSYDLFLSDGFSTWFERQFSRKLTRRLAKAISLVYLPQNGKILDAIEAVNQNYEILRQEQVLINSKNLPIQLGEWYAKSIFGLTQSKSTSQRGFDFYLNGNRVEVKVHWSDVSSPKGVKIRKSLVDLSDYCIVIYMAKNFRIREVCILDSEYILRKFSGKGHIIFLKDPEVSSYFFSKSPKHLDKVKNPKALLRFSTPTFAMKLAERFP